MENPMSAFTIHPAAHTGPVHLTVTDLGRSLDFYRDVLGFALLGGEGERATLTADGVKPLVLLTAVRDAKAKPRRSTGLYHFAILVPDRAALARSLRRLAEQRYPLGGASDHLVSEALYLSDPDGNGIEIYRDRPRAEWPYQAGQLMMDTQPLDLQKLLAEAEGPWTDLPAGTTIGHVHLHVSDLAEAERFYRALLGLELMVRYGPSAAFLSAGGYHHHLGLNTWAGVGAPPPPPDAVGLRYFTLFVPDGAEVERLVRHLQSASVTFARREYGLFLRDPSQNAVVVLPEDTPALLHTLKTLDKNEVG